MKSLLQGISSYRIDSFGRDNNSDNNSDLFPVTDRECQSIKDKCETLEQRLDKKARENVKTFKVENVEEYINNLTNKK